jgi:asparagine synthase (glutamine-hydrolysing)
MTGAGLLGYLSTDFDPARIDHALRRTPWRGMVTNSETASIGGVVGTGSATVGRHRHLIVGMHGRIDNGPELSRTLDTPGEFATSLAGEAYLRYGDAFSAQLLGDFAILILDTRRGVMLGARDWIGARPLFWGEHQGVYAFGSEVKQVLALLDRPYRLDEVTAAAYRQLGEPALTATFARGVSAIVPSGQVVVSLEHGPRLSHREIVFHPHDLSIPDAASLIRSRLETAIERRLHGATRPAALVSGGMDSTSVAATAAHLAERGKVPSLVAGVALHFADAPKTDETRYARELVDRWAIPWCPVTIRSVDLTADPTELLVPHDGPVFPGVQFFDRLFAAARQRGADLILTGQAADIWQTQNYEEILFSALRGEWWSFIKWTAYRLRRDPRSTTRQLIKTAIAFSQRKTEGEFIASRINETRSGSYWIRTAQEFEERLGQMYGVRVESPFVDRELADVLVGVSPALRSSFVGEKLPLRAAMADRLPESVLRRMDKSFFDPVFRTAYGPPSPDQSVGKMVAEHYLAAWRCHLVHGGAPFRNAQPSTGRPARAG